MAEGSRHICCCKQSGDAYGRSVCDEIVGLLGWTSSYAWAFLVDASRAIWGRVSLTSAVQYGFLGDVQEG